MSWINARKEYDNFFKNNFRIVDVCSGATRYVNKSKRKPYEMIPNKVVICDIIDHIIFLGDDVLCSKLGLSPNDTAVPNLKQFLSGKPLRSIERYKVSRIDDIDYDQQRWKIEYDDTTDKK